MKETRLHKIYEEESGRKRSLFTKNFAPGKTVYDEKIVMENGEEYRSWDPNKSKLAAALLKNISQIGIMENTVVLYLGAATGTTASHVSDIVGKDGFVFALDFAPRVVRDLVFVCENRKNMAPILGNAHHPESYATLVSEVDTIYQDIAQRDQLEIFLKNIDFYLKDGGFALLCVKARSIDVTKNPKDIFNSIKAELEKKLILVDYRNLDPFQKDHCIFICKKKN